MKGWPRGKANNYQWNQARGRRGRGKYHRPYCEPTKHRQLGGNPRFNDSPWQQQQQQQQQSPIAPPFSEGKHPNPQTFYKYPNGYSQYGGVLVGQHQQKNWAYHAYNYQQQHQQEQALVHLHDEIQSYNMHPQQMVPNAFVNDYTSYSATASKFSFVNGAGNELLRHGGTYNISSNQVRSAEYQWQPHSAVSIHQHFPCSWSEKYQSHQPHQPHFQFQLPVGPHDHNKGSIPNNARVYRHWQGNPHPQMFGSHEGASSGINRKESNLAISIMGSSDKIQNTSTSKKEDTHSQPISEPIQVRSSMGQDSESDINTNNAGNEPHPNLQQDELVEEKSLKSSSPKGSCDPISNPSIGDSKLVAAEAIPIPHDQLEEPISLTPHKHENLDVPAMPICNQSYQPLHYHDGFSSFTINPDFSTLDEIMYEQIQIVSSASSSPQSFEEIRHYEIDDPESIVSECSFQINEYRDQSGRLFTLKLEEEESELERCILQHHSPSA